MDESSIQLIGEVQLPIPTAPGYPELVDDEYASNGVASIFLEVEPLGGERQVDIALNNTVHREDSLFRTHICGIIKLSVSTEM